MLVSCSAELPTHYDQKSLYESNYVENRKDDYMLHIDEAGTRPYGLQSITEAVQDPHKNRKSTFVLKRQKQRPYFTLLTKSDTITVANRHIDFRKVANFRDIGGLKTKDGNIIQWGKIYRSDNLSQLKSSEFRKFNDMHIQAVFDLRTSNEIKGKEDQLPKGVHYIHSPTLEDSEDMLTQMRSKVIRGEVSGEQSVQLMVGLYEGMVSDNIPSIRLLIHQILDSDGAVLYHCSAGKDRTGIVTALLLSVLNVDRGTIVNEYLLSDYYRRGKIKKMLGKAKLAKIIKPHIGIEAIQHFMSVDERYINAAFDVIDHKYGGMEKYIHNELGIGDEERQLIIKKFTYNANR